MDAERQRWWDLPQLQQLRSPISTAANCVGCCASRRRSIDPHLSSPLLSPPLPSPPLNSRCYCKAFLQGVMPPDMATYWPNSWGWILDHNSLYIKFGFQQFTERKGKEKVGRLKQLRQEIWSLMLAGEIKEAGHSATTIIHIIDSEWGVTVLNGVIQRNCFKYSYWLSHQPGHKLTLRLKFQWHVQFVT